MKRLITIPLFFISIILYAQGTFIWGEPQCYYIDNKGKEVKVPCDKVNRRKGI